MNRKITLVVLFNLIFSTFEIFSQCANNSNIYSFSFNGKNYEVVREMKSWTDAAACAVERGGYLVEINDDNEQAAVYTAILNAGVSPTYTSVAMGGGIAYVWIGATDQLTEGTWIWDGNNDNVGTNFWIGQGFAGTGDGVSINANYYNWGGKSTGIAKEPDNFRSEQHHAAIGLAGWPSGTTMFGSPGEWNDINGSNLLYYVIEKNSPTYFSRIIQKSNLSVYPNPATNKIYIEGLKFSNGMKFKIVDITGKIVLNDVMNDNQIQVESLKKGIYFLKIDSEFNSYLRFYN
jgi:hypothetical protein